MRNLNPRTQRWIAAAALLGAGAMLGFVSSSIAQTRRPSLQISQLMKQELGDIEGREVSVLKLNYPPGASSAAHHHPGHVFVYVLSGELTTQLDDGPVRVYKPGEMFYEPPMGTHAQSKNDHAEERAIALAFMINPQGRPPTLPGRAPSP